MKCKNCNAEISDDSKFCPACGKDPFNEAESNMGDIPNFVSEYSNMNSKFLIKGEKIIAKAKWSKIPFILFWVLYFLGLLIFQFSPFGYIFRYGMMWLLVLIWIISIAVCALSILLFVLRRELIITDKKIYGRMGLIGTK